MPKMNCWEFKKCGREPHGSRMQELGVCPASTEWRFQEVHGGRNAGRICWFVAGTMCGGQVEGSFACKHENCEQCDFYKSVKEEEGSGFISIERLRMAFPRNP